MSVCTLIAADCPLPEIYPAEDYPLHINLDTGIIDDGGTDDNFSLLKFNDVRYYLDKQYGVYLEWPQYTEGRARNIIQYIRDALEYTDSVELWHVWLSDYERPIVTKVEVPINDLKPEDILELDSAPNWPDSFSNRPIWYCIRVLS